MYGKFINALPYYRQEKDFENQFGVKIGRGTMRCIILTVSNTYIDAGGYAHE